MIIPARTSVTGTGPARSTSPVSARDFRCAERGFGGIRPPRYTMRRTPAAAAARAKCSAAWRSMAPKSRPAAIECTR